jgi:hypothetical protein
VENDFLYDEKRIERETRVEKQSGFFDKSMLHSCKAVMQSPLEAVDAMNQVRAQDSFPDTL